ncbi:hypothetical protein CEXT_610561 [Caerostris extrusa]|uniref:Uncharacterized protein n=1 Tax=Caerostris extrusa TaxID=172846 RepID=A0AAV4S5R7_CAEEX|nr:hypothetical protein CEXT_610561 [Caerostris extrusa]
MSQVEADTTGITNDDEFLFEIPEDEVCDDWMLIDRVQLIWRFNIYDELLLDAKTLKDRLKSTQNLPIIRTERCSEFYEKVNKKESIKPDMQLIQKCEEIKDFEKKFSELWREIRLKMALLRFKLNRIGKLFTKFSEDETEKWWEGAEAAMKLKNNLIKTLPIYEIAHGQFLNDIQILIENYNL